MSITLEQKLSILSAAAKYDVSCSSSGSNRNTPEGGFGCGAKQGICHSFTEDGRCVSLLKILLSNNCRYDCAYCANRRSNDIPRATFKVCEVVDLTIGFYERNYIEGLFLSSGVILNPDYTMEALIRVAKTLRQEHRFGGYIHLKAIPGASAELVHEAALYADRMSVNVELPSQKSLLFLAPEKNYESVFRPMNFLAERKTEYLAAPKSSRYTPRFLPAGQSTQMIVGATPDSDLDILRLASGFYRKQRLKRVYYSGYIPINEDARLPVLTSQPPLLREHRLYQADWLMRFYGFQFHEIVDEKIPNLDSRFDPKLGWALRHPEFFPVDLETADYEAILRVPGIGVKSAKMIVQGRRFTAIREEHLKKLGVALNRARYFIRFRGSLRLMNQRAVNEAVWSRQGSLFEPAGLLT
ncbi:MAG: putative DNA modification/repair radical SAM protein [Fibrobacter sp.]|jgi:putative DNA modification/repair radical SAM protein|nr:putative DNA modification/repair radical SAM protein [Fibrobacter sp.]